MPASNSVAFTRHLSPDRALVTFWLRPATLVRLLGSCIFHLFQVVNSLRNRIDPKLPRLVVSKSSGTTAGSGSVRRAGGLLDRGLRLHAGVSPVGESPSLR